MSLVEQIPSEFEKFLAAERAQRLLRMKPPQQAPITAKPKPPIQPQSPAAGYENMWFYDLVRDRLARQTVPIREIQTAVCTYYRIDIMDLLSHRRTRDINVPRQVAMYLCRVLSMHSYAQIGRHFGGRDHTTVIHAAQKIEGALLARDLRLTSDVSTLRSVLS